MDFSEQSRFDKLYRRHLRMLKLQGKSDKTIDVYARAVRRVTKHFDCCPDRLTTEQLEIYFSLLVDSHSWLNLHGKGSFTGSWRANNFSAEQKSAERLPLV